jgi:enoyl-CoA hydratase/carnithine racemase
MTEPVLQLERRDGILTATLNRPHRMNSLDSELRARLTAFWREVREDDETKVVILTGAGNDAFCTGRDLKETAAAYAAAGSGPQYEQSGDYGYPHLQRTGKPIIAAINGYCLAGGLLIALGCDIRICTEGSQFGSPQVRRGRGTQLPLRLLRAGVPKAVAMDMAMTGERIGADRAYAVGIVSRLYATKDEMLAGALAIAESLLAGSSRVVRGIKVASESGLLDLPINVAASMWEDVTAMMTDDELTVARTLDFDAGSR